MTIKHLFVRLALFNAAAAALVTMLAVPQSVPEQHTTMTQPAYECQECQMLNLAQPGLHS